jgi:hydrogenase nickel incorporation protein HypA/HybF
MHELPVTQSVLDLAVQYGEQANATLVTDLYLVIGQLSSIVDDSIQFYWDMLAENTICEGATLHFERLPAILDCQECGTEYTLERELKLCPTCQSNNVVVRQGEEFRLDSIEIQREQETVP